MQEGPFFYTIPEVAALLKVSRTKLYALLNEGRLATIKLGPGRGGARRIAADELRRFIGELSSNRTEPR